MSTQGVPHHLGVLSHFRGAVWYLGDNRLTQDPEDEVTETVFGDFEDVAVAEREQELTIAVRDFLNEGGKLVHTGETATYYGPDFPADIDGIYYGLNGDPSADCVVTEDPFSDCLLLADDFAQYYLGRVHSRHDADTATGFTGRRRARRDQRRVRRTGRHRQPDRRGRDLPGDQLGADAGPVPAVHGARRRAPTSPARARSTRSRAACTSADCTSTTPTCG